MIVAVETRDGRSTPQAADAWYALGRAYSLKRQPSDALDAFKRAIKAQPGHESAVNALGIQMFDKGLVVAAIKLFQEAWAAAPTASIMINLGHALSVKHRYADAIEVLSEARAMCEDTAQRALGLAALSRAQVLAGEYDAAVVSARDAAALEPMDPVVNVALARALWHTDVRDGALAAYDTAMAADRGLAGSTKVLCSVLTFDDGRKGQRECADVVGDEGNGEWLRRFEAAVGMAEARAAEAEAGSGDGEGGGGGHADDDTLAGDTDAEL